MSHITVDKVIKFTGYKKYIFILCESKNENKLFMIKTKYTDLSLEEEPSPSPMINHIKSVVWNTTRDRKLTITLENESIMIQEVPSEKYFDALTKAIIALENDDG